jgi:hypothetical protein
LHCNPGGREKPGSKKLGFKVFKVSRLLTREAFTLKL